MSDTFQQILDEAQVLVQERGYNAFSFRDLTKTLKITSAGIHYHFPTKAALGKALVVRYKREFMSSLELLSKTNSGSLDRIRGFIQIYGETLRSSKFCLCGMMASDALTLPEEVYSEVQGFFEAAEEWLSGILLIGKESKELNFDGTALDEAQFFLAAVEGAMLVSWPLLSSDPKQASAKFKTITDRLIAELSL